MNLKLITTASDPNHPGWLQFKRSLDYFAWDYHLIVHTYTNFNDKIIAFYDYLITHRAELDYFIYADSYDSFALSTQKEVEEKIKFEHGVMYSTEKACWPYTEWAGEYPESPYPHKYLNGGGFVGKVEDFIRMYESDPIANSGKLNDQVWAADHFLRKNNDRIFLDTKSDIFQCIGHTDKDEFKVKGKRLINKHTGSKPVLIHGNGHSKLDWVYELL